MNKPLGLHMNWTVRGGRRASTDRPRHHRYLKLLGGSILRYSISRWLKNMGNNVEVLKQQKFTPQGKQERIEASLAALNAPQPTELSLAQWKEVIEEIEADE